MNPNPMQKGFKSGAFSLIELLVVISIIGVLASLVVGLSALASRKGKESRVVAELNLLVTALEKYHAKKGAYPPDNVVRRDPYIVVNPAINQLFYELSGVVVDNDSFRTVAGNQRISVGAVRQLFNTDGFVNAGVDPKEVENFLPWLRASQYKEASSAPPVALLLVVPVDWPKSAPSPPLLAKPGLNPWRYVSTNPTNNPASFDLWAEVWIGGKKKIFGNWRQ